MKHSTQKHVIENVSFKMAALSAVLLQNNILVANADSSLKAVEEAAVVAEAQSLNIVVDSNSVVYEILYSEEAAPAVEAHLKNIADTLPGDESIKVLPALKGHRIIRLEQPYTVLKTNVEKARETMVKVKDRARGKGKWIAGVVGALVLVGAGVVAYRKYSN